MAQPRTQVLFNWGKSVTYKRTGLPDRPEKAWSRHGGSTRVFAHEVTC